MRSLFAALLLTGSPVATASSLAATAPGDSCTVADRVEILNLDGTLTKGGGTTLSTRDVFTGGNSSYVRNFSIKQPIRFGSGIRFRFEIDGWESIRYIAFGWVDTQNRFWHIKAPHMQQGRPHDELVSIDHPLFKLTNTNWRNAADARVKGIRVFVAGQPGENGGSISVEGATMVDHGSNLYFQSIPLGETYCSLDRYEDWAPTLEDADVSSVVSKLTSYLTKKTPEYTELAQENVGPETLRMRAVPAAPWPFGASHPTAIADFTTSRYLWHALNHVMASLLQYRESADPAHLFFAHLAFNRWYDRNIDQETEDPKYAWYDHGVAERAMVLSVLYRDAVEQTFDVRTRARILHALHMHTELLAAESFYARNQPDRWHNHAVFQDAAVLSSAGVLKPLQSSDKLSAVARRRGLEQLRKLSTTEDGYTINNENSAAYHTGMILLAELLADFDIVEDPADNEFRKVYREMSKFDQLLQYPDGRYPAYGDSHRSVNDAVDKTDWVLPEIDAARVHAFDKAGIVIAEAGGEIPWQLTTVGTDQSIVHKHADNLSVSLWADGVEWLIDPGFYTLEFDDPTTVYARGGSAHNHVSFPDVEAPVAANTAELTASQADDGTISIQGTDTTFSPYATISRSISVDGAALKFSFTELVQRTADEARREGASEAGSSTVAVESEADDDARIDSTAIVEASAAELDSTVLSDAVDAEPVIDTRAAAVTAPASLFLHLGEGVSATKTGDHGFDLVSPHSEVTVRLSFEESQTCSVVTGASAPDDGKAPTLGFSFPSFAEAVPIQSIICPLPESGELRWSLDLNKA